MPEGRIYRDAPPRRLEACGHGRVSPHVSTRSASSSPSSPRSPWPIILAVRAAVAALILGSGLWRGLSVTREYATHADSFWQEGAKHVELAFGSLAAAVVVGLPLGVACHRSVALRGATLPVLNIIQ